MRLDVGCRLATTHAASCSRLAAPLVCELRAVAPNAWDFDVDTEIIDHVANLYESYLSGPLRQLEAAEADYSQLATPAGPFFVFRAGQAMGWNSDISWVSVDDSATHQEFDAIFRALQVPERLGKFIEHTTRVQLYCAFFVVRKSCTAPHWHEDYVADLGTNAMTLITPIRTYAPRKGFEVFVRKSPAGIEPGRPTPHATRHAMCTRRGRHGSCARAAPVRGR